MKLRDGVAEDLTIPRLYVADIGEGLNGITDAINCLQNGSVPVGENLARVTALLSSAALVLSSVNRELLSIVADGDELHDAMTEGTTSIFQLSPAVAATIYRVLTWADCERAEGNGLAPNVTDATFIAACRALEAQGVTDYTPELNEGGES